MFRTDDGPGAAVVADVRRRLQPVSYLYNNIQFVI